MDPDATGIGLASGQDRDRGVVPVQSLGAQSVGLKALEQRRQRRRAAADLVGQGRQADRHTLLGTALRLPVERLMLTKLLEQHHRQQAWPRAAPGDHVERRRGLADLLAITTGELFADVLDHLPGFRDDLQRLDATVERILAGGGKLAGCIATITERAVAGIRGLYLRDPFGVVIELLESK